MRQIAAAPARYRKEFIMSSELKAESYYPERRKPVGIAKFIRKQPTTRVKRDSAGSTFRRNYLVKASVKQKENSNPGKIPRSVSLKLVSSARDEYSPEGTAEQEPLPIPNLIKEIQQDGMVILMGSNEVCFATFTLQYKHPRAVVYNGMEGDKVEIPWLCLPFPSSGESWLFHPINDDDNETTFTCIPEINCVIPTKALRMHMNVARTTNKSVALKILWIGHDSKKRQGSIYVLPMLPKLIICGPFPHYLMTTRFNSNSNRLGRIMKMCSYVNELNGVRSIGDDDNGSEWDDNVSDLSSPDISDSPEERRSRIN